MAGRLCLMAAIALAAGYVMNCNSDSDRQPVGSGVPEVDRVIQAVRTGDATTLTDMVWYSTIECLSEITNALTAEPICHASASASGLSIEYMPVLAAGQPAAIPRSEIASFLEARLSQDNLKLLGVYKLPGEHPEFDYAVVYNPASEPDQVFVIFLAAGRIFAVIYPPVGDAILPPRDDPGWLIRSQDWGQVVVRA